MKKIFYSILLACCLVTKTLAADTKKLIVLLDWFANPNHAPLFIAQEKGYFKEQNLDVELIGPADPSDPPKLVAAGKADIAITYEPQLIEQVERDLPLVRIGTLIDKPLSCLVVLKDSQITSLADLNHKRIGYSVGGISTAALTTMLKKHDLTLDDVERINVHYDLTQALLSKRVDAVTGMMRNFEILQLELAGHPARAFFPEKNGVPTYSELIFVVNKNKIHDPRYIKFLNALEKGLIYLKNHPEESWDLFVKSHPEVNNELNHRAWFATLPYFTNNPKSFNKQDWEHFINFMQQNHLIEKNLPIESYAIILKV